MHILHSALSYSKPKEILIAVDRITQLSLPDNFAGRVSKALSLIEKYRYADALKIIDECLGEL